MKEWDASRPNRLTLPYGRRGSIIQRNIVNQNSNVGISSYLCNKYLKILAIMDYIMNGTKV